MRPGTLHLDLTTEEYLTNPDVTGKAEIHAGNHIVRDGIADNHWLKSGGHPDGRPLRIARDLISGNYFVKIADHLPSDLSTPQLERQKEKIEKQKPFHVAGAGFWIPLDELYPNHPHSKLFNQA